MEAWLKVMLESNPILVWFADEARFDEKQRETTIKQLISGRTNIDKKSIRPAAPIPLVGKDEKPIGTPHYDLLLDLPADVATKLLGDQGQMTLAKDGKAIHLSKFPPDVDNFLAIVKGFRFEDTESEECCALIRKTLSTHNGIKQLVISYSTPSIPPISPETTFSNWCNSLQVEVMPVGVSNGDTRDNPSEPAEQLFDIDWKLFAKPLTTAQAQRQLLTHISTLRPKHDLRG